MKMRKTKFKPNGIYHIYNRGNRKKKIFFTERDFLRFKNKLDFYALDFNIETIITCLIPNHFHLEILQKSQKTISDFMQRIGLSHTKYINVKYDLVGHLYQGKFQSRQIRTYQDFLKTSQYIINNPVKHELVSDSKNYRWLWVSTLGLEHYRPYFEHTRPQKILSKQ